MKLRDLRALRRLNGRGRTSGHAGAAATGPARPSEAVRGVADADLLPRDPRTDQPILPRPQPGYYPGYSTLSQQAFWDEATRTVVLDRVHQIPPIRFFSPEEHETMVAVAGRILPQEDRDPEHQIPLVPFIDERLYENRSSGYQYADMPPDREAYHLGLKGIQAIAQFVFRAPFQQLRADEQDYVLETIHDERPPAGDEYWERMDVKRFWQMLVNDHVSVYYAHPWAWDEIGFGGPAYPRGYMRLHHGQPEPWEVEERRYEWQAPPRSRSDVYRPIGRRSPLEQELHSTLGGAAGTH
jgi:hypothetical protein